MHPISINMIKSKCVHTQICTKMLSNLCTGEDLKAFDITQEPEQMHELYGKSNFGQGCLLARRLIENQVRYVEVSRGGWDTHDNNFEAVANNCMDMDKALSALLLDLEMRGLLKRLWSYLPLNLVEHLRLTQEMEETTGHTGSQPSSLVEELRVELSTVKWIKLAEILRKENLLTQLL